MTPHQDSQRGIDAQAVLDNPAFKDGIEAMREAIIRQWRDCPMRDDEGQRLLLQAVKLADTVEAALVGFVQAGRMAQRHIDIEKARSESKPRQFMKRVL